MYVDCTIIFWISLLYPGSFPLVTMGRSKVFAAKATKDSGEVFVITDYDSYFTIIFTVCLN